MKSDFFFVLFSFKPITEESGSYEGKMEELLRYRCVSPEQEDIADTTVWGQTAASGGE